MSRVLVDLGVADDAAAHGSYSTRAWILRRVLRSLVEGKDILLVTARDQREKYGRYLGELWLDGDGGPRNVNDELVAAGHAAYKKY